MPRFIERASTDPAGLAGGVELPYNLQGQDVLRTVEDIHGLLHEVNSMLFDRGYDRLEELLDRAGFSGFVSRSVVDRIDRLSRALVQNGYHNGYPDLVPRGVYVDDAVQHGTQGGLEVKASRNPSSWESHGPRGGWFCIVQFSLDEAADKALQDREPTKILTVMIAQLTESDWSWQPAKEGRIRSGTASIKPSGAVKLRSSAVWVEPTYREEHEARLAAARRTSWRTESAAADCLELLDKSTVPMRLDEVTNVISGQLGIPPQQLRSTVQATLNRLVKEGSVFRPARGEYSAS